MVGYTVKVAFLPALSIYTREHFSRVAESRQRHDR